MIGDNFCLIQKPRLPPRPFLTSSRTFFRKPSTASTEAGRQTSPGNALFLSRLCPSDLRPCVPYKHWTLKISAFSSRMAASYPLPVRRASGLPAASFRFRLATDNLCHSARDSPCRAHRGLAPPRKCALPGAQSKTPRAVCAGRKKELKRLSDRIQSISELAFPAGDLWTDNRSATSPPRFEPSCRYLPFRVLEWLRYDAHGLRQASDVSTSTRPSPQPQHMRDATCQIILL